MSRQLGPSKGSGIETALHVFGQQHEIGLGSAGRFQHGFRRAKVRSPFVHATFTHRGGVGLVSVRANVFDPGLAGR